MSLVYNCIALLLVIFYMFPKHLGQNFSRSLDLKSKIIIYYQFKLIGCCLFSVTASWGHSVWFPKCFYFIQYLRRLYRVNAVVPFTFFELMLVWDIWSKVRSMKSSSILVERAHHQKFVGWYLLLIPKRSCCVCDGQLSGCSCLPFAYIFQKTDKYLLDHHMCLKTELFPL